MAELVDRSRLLGLFRGTVHHRLAIPLTEDPELAEFFFGELFIALREIQHRVVEPLLLVLRLRFEHSQRRMWLNISSRA